MPKSREHNTRRSKKLQLARKTPTMIKDEPTSPAATPPPMLEDDIPVAVKYEETIAVKNEKVEEEEQQEAMTYEPVPMKCEEELIIEADMEMHMMSDDAECAEVEVADEMETTSELSTNSKLTQSSSSQRMKFKQSGSAPTTPSPTKTAAAATIALGSKKRKGRRGSGTSSDEERWLTAIEAGKLLEVDDEMKKIKNPKLMTARQRAMYDRNLDKEPFPGTELMSLPSGYREKEKPQTAEELQKAALKSQRRKQQADEKREKDKKKTMERLLKKQDTKQQRSAARNKNIKILEPMMSYRNSLEGTVIIMPPDHKFPLQKQKPRQPPKVQLCSIPGCGKPKVYSCSKTHVPLCSLGCYRKNVQSISQIIC